MSKFKKPKEEMANCKLSRDGMHQLCATRKSRINHYHGGENQMNEIISESTDELLCHKCLNIFDLNMIRYKLNADRISTRK